MVHLDDEELLSAADPTAALTPQVRSHLAECAACAERVTATARLAAAARTADQMLTGPADVPSFDTLIVPALPAGRRSIQAGAVADTAPPEAVPRPGLRRSSRVARQLVAAQYKLVPGYLLPLTAVGFALAVCLAVVVPDPGWRGAAFGALVSLLLLAGGLAVSGPRTDPRWELLMVLPVTPRAVFLARLVLVLAVDLTAALLATGLAALLDHSVDSLVLISGWLGPSLLSASVAVLLTIWRAYWLGSLAGALVWFSAVVADLPARRVPNVGVGAILDAVWSGSTFPAVVSVLLLALAVRLVPEPRRISI
ncbi:hypothetical protein [Salinispora vitiensis]|uniref:hypothetical protein n=1 Tax=Salinispora vitiensis TaxID=999544 RepID=UPI00037BC8E2|nr:hypothetical protein [Salinispora vitiensis]